MYHLTLSAECLHKPTGQWHTARQTGVGVRARGVREALDKGLRQVVRWPAYADRVGHADWTCHAEAQIERGTL